MLALCRPLLPLLVLWLVNAFVLRADEPPRYWALWRDDAQQGGATLEGNWWDADAKFAGRRLFDPAKPVRFLCDLNLKLGAPTAYVLLANGDVLPGRVTQYAPAAADGDLPARLLVITEPPGLSVEATGVWVRADRVLRIVAVKADAPAREPGMIVLANGRTLAANAVRWTERGIRALTETGIVSADFLDLADLHVPKVDVTAAVLDDGDFPPLPDERLIARVETTDGAAVTFRRGMTFRSQRVIVHKRSKTSETRTYLSVQPGWALGALQIPVETVACVSFRDLNEIPLAHLPTEVVEQRVGIHSWAWQRNRNVRGEMLHSGQVLGDLGVGTHSYLELAFTLPPGAKEFSSLLGIDASVGSGGCSAAKVIADRPSRKTLFASGFLRGSEEPVRVGPVALGKAERLVLLTDFAHNNRPSGAYPFDIGDHVNWIFPLVTIEPRTPDRGELVRRFVAGWERWQLAEKSLGPLRLLPRWNESVSRWTTELTFTDKATLELTRTVNVRPYVGDVLEVVLSPDSKRFADRFELLVDGVRQDLAAERVMSFNSHIEKMLKEKRALGKNAPPPHFRGVVLRWDLQAFAGREAALALRVSGDKDSEPLAWHALRFVGPLASPPADGELPKPDVLVTALEAKGYSGTYKPQVNRIPKSGRADRPIRLMGRTFDCGYGFAGNAAIAFDIQPNYKRFVALAGCCADVVGPLQVLIDDKVVWEAAVLDENSPAVPISVDIPAEAKKLTLKVIDTNPGYGAAAFVNAGFMTE